MIFYYGLFFYNHLTITIFIKHYFNKMNGRNRTILCSDFVFFTVNNIYITAFKTQILNKTPIFITIQKLV